MQQLLRQTFRLFMSGVMLLSSLVFSWTSSAPRVVHASSIITQWTFNGSTTTPAVGSGTASLVGGTTASFATGVGGESNGGWNTTNYPAQGSGNKTAGAQFQVDASSYTNITMSFAVRRSNTAANTVVVQFSTDGGASFTDVYTDTVFQGNIWVTPTVDLSSYSVSVPDLRIRVVTAFSPTTSQYFAASPSSSYGTGGTVRFDNVTIYGTLSGDLAPSVSAVSPPNSATDVPLDSNVVITFSEPVNVSGTWFQITCPSSGARDPSNTTVTGGPTVFTLDPNTDFDPGETCTLTVYAAQVADQDTNDPPDNMAADFVSSFTTVSSGPPAICASGVFTPIYTIQGNGATSPLVGDVVTVRGVVVGDFEGPAPALRGFYLQEEVGDDDPSTSDGVFVFNHNNNDVSIGQRVVLTGTVGEFFGQTQITRTLSQPIVDCGSASLPAPVYITLPLTSADDLERFEGMRVRLPQELVVTDNYYLGRFGQVSLAFGGRLWQPTQVVTPGAPALVLQAQNALNTIILDDATNQQNPDPVIFARNGLTLTAANTLRGGDTVSNVVGVLTYGWGGASASPNAYRVRPTEPVTFVAANPRPAPVPRAGALRVANANLLNYFNTFGAGNCTNGVGGAPTDCRGASNAAEFQRQISKTVAALLGSRADIIAVQELENDGYGANSAIQDLVDRLNAATAPGTFAFIDADANTGATNALGTDAIKVGLIYKPEKVKPVGATAVLTTGAFGLFVLTDTTTIQRNRPPLAQSFEERISGERFTVVVNHLKSKGSSCANNGTSSPAPNDDDANDGQGNCNRTRTVAAQELAAWLATDPTGIADPDILIIGDLNSYLQEDPIRALKDAGYVHVTESRMGEQFYSYSFRGQWGALDHALASPTLDAQIIGAHEWHVNADEPVVLDYNTEFKSPAQQSYFYAPDAYRASDHDLLLVDLLLNVAPKLTAIATYDTGLGNNGAEIIAVRGDWGALTNAGDKSFDRLDLSDILSPTLVGRVGPTAVLSGLNSLAIHPTKDLILAVAGGAAPAASPVHGKVIAYRLSSGAYITEALVGIQPDAIAISPDGNFAVVANEAEAPGTGDNGGPGSLSIVDLSSFDPDAPTPLNVITLSLPSQASTPGFSAGRYDDVGRLLIDNAPNTLEPESVAFSADSQFAYVSLQENNGVVRVELTPPYTLTFFGLYSTTHQADLTNGGGYQPVEVLTAWREPDGIAVIEVGSTSYFVTADEGDTRPSPSSAGVRGGRTVSIFRADNGALVADTAGQLDDTAARWRRYPDNRSNRGGSEPEVLDAAIFEGRAIVAVGLERANAVALVDMTVVTEPVVFGLIPTGAAPEGVKLAERNDALYVLAANEVSGTLTIARVPVGQHIFTQRHVGAGGFPLHDLQVLDPDLADVISVTLQLADAAQGMLGLSLVGGATGSFAPALGSYAISGTITDVNASLATLVFTPTIGVSDTVVISVTAGDGDQTDFGLVRLQVNANVSVALTTDPSTTPVGTSALLTATVTDLSGAPVPDGTAVSFATSLGSVAPATATTLGGVATATVSSTLAGTALVTATAVGVDATALVTFTVGAPASLALTATPNLILANGISQSVVVAQVTDAFGNPVPGVPVLFLAGIGNFSPNSGTTDATGRVTVTLTSTVPGSEMVYGTAGSLSGGAMVTYVQPPAPDTGLGGNLTTVTNTLGVVRKGDIITYTVVITNNGSGVVNNILLYAPIPSGTTYVAGSATGGSYFGSLALGPLATLAGVVWSGSLAPGESHVLIYAVRAQILEGRITNEPKVFVDNVDTGIVLSSIVDVEALRIYLPIAAKP